jgi:hypothetical protein
MYGSSALIGIKATGTTLFKFVLFELLIAELITAAAGKLDKLVVVVAFSFICCFICGCGGSIILVCISELHFYFEKF